MEAKALLVPVAIVFIYYAPSVWRALVNNWKVCDNKKYKVFSSSPNLYLQLRSIPTVGTNALLAPFIGPRRYVTHAHEMLQEGYDKVHHAT